jgi:glutathionyl-hydroquinone reductase
MTQYSYKNMNSEIDNLKNETIEKLGNGLYKMGFISHKNVLIISNNL